MINNNNFPNIDTVIRNLKSFVTNFKEKEKESNDERERHIAKMSLETVDDYINSIGRYLDSVCNTDSRIQRFKDKTDDAERIKDYVSELDRDRTRAHSTIISSMAMIDRICKRMDLNSVFDIDEKTVEESSYLEPLNYEEKRQMTPEDRKLRRYYGNFGLYIGASFASGFSISEEEIEKFASGESISEDTKEKISNSNKVRANFDRVM